MLYRVVLYSKKRDVTLMGNISQTVDKSPISSERDWTFSMYKMKINVEISIIKTANMI